MERYNKTTKNARWALLLMLILTVANLAWVLIRGNTEFVATAAIPEVVTLTGILGYVLDWPLYILILCGFVVAAVLVTYFLCWFYGKKRDGAMTTALIMYCVDYVARMYLLVCDIMEARSWMMILFRVALPTAFLIAMIRGEIARRKRKALL